MGTEALRCGARDSWKVFETRKACDLRAKVLFPQKKPRVNPNSPRCPERTFCCCTSDEHYHTHPHHPAPQLHARVNNNDKHDDDEAHALRPHVSNGFVFEDSTERLLRTHAGAASSLLSRDGEEFVRA